MISAKILAYARQNALLLVILAGVIALGLAGLARQIRVEARIASALAEVNARVQQSQSDMWRVVGAVDKRVQIVQQAEASTAATLRRIDAETAKRATTINGSDRYAERLSDSLRASDSPVPILLGDSLAAEGHIEGVINAAMSGSVLVDAAALLSRVRAYGAWDKVSCILISTGFNDARFDLGRNDEGRDPIGFFATMLDTVIATANGKPLVLMTISMPESGYEGTEPAFIDRLNAVIRSRAGQVEVFDMASRFPEAVAEAGVAKPFRDQVHMSLEGQRIRNELTAEAASLCGD